MFVLFTSEKTKFSLHRIDFHIATKLLSSIDNQIRAQVWILKKTSLTWCVCVCVCVCKMAIIFFYVLSKVMPFLANVIPFVTTIHVTRPCMQTNLKSRTYFFKWREETMSFVQRMKFHDSHLNALRDTTTTTTTTTTTPWRRVLPKKLTVSQLVR